VFCFDLVSVQANCLRSTNTSLPYTTRHCPLTYQLHRRLHVGRYSVANHATSKTLGSGLFSPIYQYPSPISQGIARTHSQPSQVGGWANECGKSCHSKVVRWMEHRSYPCRQQTPFHSSLTRRSNTTSDSATSSDQCSHTLSGFLTCRRAFRIHKSGPGGF